ncbi:FAD-dependent oxidoreductase [Phytohabitans kaempferiae]|uniref:FAD-dependent oxidoreductase n=1 Tax=Phytohabitans kaempferiae TaxID=1620943 RepID=A0ABV6MAA8_9ACTN
MAVIDAVHDVAVFGTGHAGYAAALALAHAGRAVLLVGERGDLVWESGRGLFPVSGECDEPEWRSLASEVTVRGGGADGWLDGAITEVVATDRIMRAGVAVLYYARPVGVEIDHGLVTAVVVATRAGLRRVRARQWIDATETGSLVMRVDLAASPRQPVSRFATMALQHPAWDTAGDGLQRTTWPTERLLTVEVPESPVAMRDRLLSALVDLEERSGDATAHMSLSHWSIEPVARFSAGGPDVCGPENLVNASASFVTTEISTLADRHMLGVRAAAQCLAGARADGIPDRSTVPASIPTADRLIRSDVCIAGAGTGGAMAAIAAARAGAQVVAVEAQSFIGGIGTGGGIHGYWFGVSGGLQKSLDARTRALMKELRGGPFGDGPFNPWAKLVVLERWFAEENVDAYLDAILFGVERSDDRLVAALIADVDGITRIEAGSFVDGTGDGDLCALAGAEFTLGRPADGMLHAYSQSSGRLADDRGRPRMAMVNFDAGFCDPTDPEDVSRARLAGIRQYLVDRYDNLSRPTYVAPMLGVRQGRQVITERMLTLDDLISRVSCDDPIGYIGSHYDSHASDYEFESDEAVFWCWLNRQHALPMACEVSYRTIVPRGLTNVWIASRCLGATQDMQYVARMQRDMQRIGEAAGYAAAESARQGRAALEIDYAAIRAHLEASGAMGRAAQPSLAFGAYPFGGSPMTTTDATADNLTLRTALESLDRTEPGEPLWWLYRHESLAHEAVLARLDDERPFVSWLAAGIAAMWGEPAAEPRLIAAINSLEYGYGRGYEWTLRRPGSQPARPIPEHWSAVAPNWLCALALLRRCGTQASLTPIERLLDLPTHGINTLTTVALTLERLVTRHQVDDDESRKRVLALLDRLAHVERTGYWDLPGRPTGRTSELAVRGQSEDDQPGFLTWAEGTAYHAQLRNAFQDNTWQLDLSIARASVALGLRPHGLIERYQKDGRAIVRRAFSSLHADVPPFSLDHSPVWRS